MNATQLKAHPATSALFIPDRVAERARTRHVPDLDTGCLISTYSSASHGYAQIGWHHNRERIVTLCHRVVWASTHGPIPHGMTIDHTCKTKKCVNIEHLRLISNFENARRTSGRDWPLGQCINGHANAFLIKMPNGKTACFICARYYWRSGACSPQPVKMSAKPKVAKPRHSKPAAPRPPKTHCRNGHEWIPENFYTRPSGRVECLPCKESHAKQWHTAARAEAKRAA